VALAQFGAVDVRAGADASALHLARRDADADARAANQDAAVAFAGRNRLRRAVAIHGVIAGNRRVRAEILPFQSHRIQQLHHFLFEFNAGVVASQSNHEKILLYPPKTSKRTIRSSL
jgi:hypothetical protein